MKRKVTLLSGTLLFLHWRLLKLTTFLLELFLNQHWLRMRKLLLRWNRTFHINYLLGVIIFIVKLALLLIIVSRLFIKIWRTILVGLSHQWFLTITTLQILFCLANSCTSKSSIFLTSQSHATDPSIRRYISRNQILWGNSGTHLTIILARSWKVKRLLLC